MHSLLAELQRLTGLDSTYLTDIDTQAVPAVFGDSSAARDLGLQTYTGVAVRDESGNVTDTLCGASTRRIPLGQTTLQVMESFADLISQARNVAQRGVLRRSGFGGLWRPAEDLPARGDALALQRVVL